MERIFFGFPAWTAIAPSEWTPAREFPESVKFGSVEVDLGAVPQSPRLALPGAPHVCFGIGWSGNGVNPSRIGGRILASLALDKRDRWAQNGPVNRGARRFPPEPLRFLGGAVVRAAMARKDRREIAGQPMSLLDRALAHLAPSGLEDKS